MLWGGPFTKHSSRIDPARKRLISTRGLASSLIWLPAAAMLVVLSTISAPGQVDSEVWHPAAHGEPEAQTLTGMVSCEWQVIGRYNCRMRALQDCVQECVRLGSAYVLVADRRMYWLSGKPSELGRFAGGMALVTGTVEGTKASVLSIADGEKHRRLGSWKSRAKENSGLCQ